MGLGVDRRSVRGLESPFRNGNREVRVYVTRHDLEYFSRMVRNEPRTSDETGRTILKRLQLTTRVHHYLRLCLDRGGLTWSSYWPIACFLISYASASRGGLHCAAASCKELVKNNVEARSITWLIPPASFQRLPYTIWEPSTSRSLRALTLDDFYRGGKDRVLGERLFPTENLVYHNPEGITI